MIERPIAALCALLCCLPAWAAPLDEGRMAALESEPGSWLTHGRNYAETRESPLTGINTENVSRLGLAWQFEPGTKRGLEATPLVIDGVLFTTGGLWPVTTGGLWLVTTGGVRAPAVAGQVRVRL